MTNSSEKAGGNPPRAQCRRGDEQPIHCKYKENKSKTRHNVEITKAAAIWSTKKRTLRRVSISFSAVKQRRLHSRDVVCT